MTNEELAVRIKQGERDKLEELWNQVERLIWKMANRRAYSLEGRNGVTSEDLYQAGYLAMVDAVGYFDPTADIKFTTYLGYSLKTAFAEAGGYRSKKQAKDPLHHAGSLDAPLSDDPDAGTLGDVIEDPAGLKGVREVEEGIDRRQLHATVEKALAAIPENQSAVLRARYYQGQTLEGTGAELGLSRERVRQLEAKGLRALRHPRISRELKGYL